MSWCVHLRLGVLQAGRPEFGVDVDNIKPMEVVVAAALGMLLFGKPLSGSRAFGGMQFGLPVNGDATAKVGFPFSSRGAALLCIIVPG